MRPALGALVDALVMPLVMAFWGFTTLGCVSWGMFLVLLPLIANSFGWMGWACLAWSLFAIPIGCRNYGRFLRYFQDREGSAKSLFSVVGWSIPLIASNPLLLLAWLN